MQEHEEKFKVGDMVKLVNTIANYGIIVAHRIDMSISCAEWLVHMQEGWEVWCCDNDIEHVGL